MSGGADRERGDHRWRSIGQIVTEAAALHPDRLAIVDGEAQLTYQDLAAESHRFSGALLKTGVSKGDRIAIWAPNGARWIVAALGAQSIGAVIVPLNTRFSGHEAGHVLDRSSPSVLLLENDFLGKDYTAMLKDAGHELNIPAIELSDRPASTLIPWREFAESGQPDEAVAAAATAVGASDFCDMMFTSGTTGKPKAVLATHGQTLRAYYDWSTLSGMTHGDRYAIINPFFHAFGYKAGWLSALMHTMTIYPHSVLNAEALFRQTERDRITILPGPPTLYTTLLADASRERYDLSSLRLAITGATTIPSSLVRDMIAKLGFQRVTTCYGLTEACAVATITRDADSLETVAQTSGRPLPGIEVRVTSEDGKVCAPGDVGEILVRGYNVIPTYVDETGGTASRVDEEGWLHTGDLGRIDRESNLTVTGRKGDMFIVGGFNAYPAEIEAAMLEHPSIRDVSVIGVPDERLGEVGFAFVVGATESDPDADAILAWAKTRLANFKVPRQIAIVPELPRNSVGKVLKSELRLIAAKVWNGGGTEDEDKRRTSWQ